jgi:D-alanyl-D-alanine carboxypeptidase
MLSKKQKLLVTCMTLLLGIVVSLYVWQVYVSTDVSNSPLTMYEEAEDQSGPDRTIQTADTITPPIIPSATEVPSQWPIQLSYEQATSIHVVVNKKHRLPSDYVPMTVSGNGAQLRSEALTALNALYIDAQSVGLAPKTISSYRSFSTQSSVYSNFVAEDGQAEADTYSARPGHSEHQTGLAVDVGDSIHGCDLETCFGATPFGEWLKTNAHKYGFIIRYPEGREAETGYQYEPWHLRFVGTDTALAIYSSSQTLDQYFGITAGDY